MVFRGDKIIGGVDTGQSRQQRTTSKNNRRAWECFRYSQTMQFYIDRTQHTETLLTVTLHNKRNGVADVGGNLPPLGAVT